MIPHIASKFLIIFAAVGVFGCSNTPIQPLPQPLEPNALQQNKFDWHIVSNFRPFSSPGVNIEQERAEGRQLFWSSIHGPQARHLQFALMMFDLDEQSRYEVTTDNIWRHFIEDENRYWIGTEKYNKKVGDAYVMAPVERYDPFVAYTPARRAIVAVTSNITGECRWKVVEPETGIEQTRIKPCARVELSIGNQGGLNIEVTPILENIPHQLTIEYTENTILALGDSYISGEGTEPFIDTQCSVSSYSWPYLVSAIMAYNDPKNVYTIINRACSGARTEHVISETFGGPLWENNEVSLRAKKQPQIRQAKADLCNVPIDSADDCNISPDYIFLSIGGNDAGFGDTVKESILKNIDETSQRFTLESQNTRSDNLRKAYSQLALKFGESFPKSKIYATNYLNPLRKYNGDLCSDREVRGFVANPFRRLLKLAGIQLSREEMQVLESNYIDPLLGERGLAKILKELETRLSDHWRFVKTYHSLSIKNSVVDSKYATRGLCEGTIRSQERKWRELPRRAENSWFNSLEDVDRTENPSGIVHPNIFGQAYYARRVLETMCEIDEPRLCRFLNELN